jgi:CheY-like chemotaxis protein
MYALHDASTRSRRAHERADISHVDDAARSILVVDDNEVNRALLVRQLQRLGHEATAVPGAVQALEAVAATPFALILMDCRMPGMDGMEATRRIREAEAQTGERIPVVAVTANAMEADRQACFAAGMDDFLTKPVMLESLREIVERFLADDQPTP